MATFTDIAREVSIYPVICGACSQQISTNRAFQDLFDRILARLRAGETVKIRGFGTFRPAVHTPRGFARSSGPQPVVRFSLTRNAKRIIRSEP